MLLMVLIDSSDILGNGASLIELDCKHNQYSLEPIY